MDGEDMDSLHLQDPERIAALSLASGIPDTHILAPGHEASLLQESELSNLGSSLC